MPLPAPAGASTARRAMTALWESLAETRGRRNPAPPVHKRTGGDEDRTVSLYGRWYEAIVQSLLDEALRPVAPGPAGAGMLRALFAPILR